MSVKKYLVAFLMLLATALSFSGQAQYKDGKLYLNADGSQYLKMTLLNQVWVRYNDSNPGTTVYGYDKSSTTDVGIRRLRMQLFGQISERGYIYVQLGQNNFNYLSDRKAGFFLHDAVAEYQAVKNKLSVGGGLSGWSGLARFASPSVGSIMGIDAPLFEQATADVTDQFLRKLSVYAKGKLGKFDYRMELSDPMAFQKSTSYNAAVAKASNFASSPAKFQSQGYFQYQFLDQESNLNPYTQGTYLGAKRVFNIGAGFVYQPDAMWHLGDNGKDTVKTAMRLLAVDAYYDAPVDKEKGTAISAYAVYADYDFGPNYVRMGGPMNPANGNKLATVLNGAGNAFPMYGTGQTVYAQVGYKMKKDLLGKAGTLMPYVSMQHSNFEKLTDAVNYYDIGINWLMSGHGSKLTLAYQDRPIYSTTDYKVSERKGTLLLQYQVFLN